MSGAFSWEERSFSNLGVLDMAERSCVGIDFGFHKVENFGSQGVLSFEFVNGFDVYPFRLNF